MTRLSALAHLALARLGALPLLGLGPRHPRGLLGLLDDPPRHLRALPAAQLLRGVHRRAHQLLRRLWVGGRQDLLRQAVVHDLHALLQPDQGRLEPVVALPQVSHQKSVVLLELLRGPSKLVQVQVSLGFVVHLPQQPQQPLLEVQEHVHLGKRPHVHLPALWLRPGGQLARALRGSPRGEHSLPPGGEERPLRVLSAQLLHLRLPDGHQRRLLLARPGHDVHVFELLNPELLPVELNTVLGVGVVHGEDAAVVDLACGRVAGGDPLADDQGPWDALGQVPDPRPLLLEPLADTRPVRLQLLPLLVQKLQGEPPWPAQRPPDHRPLRPLQLLALVPYPRVVQKVLEGVPVEPGLVDGAVEPLVVAPPPHLRAQAVLDLAKHGSRGRVGLLAPPEQAVQRALELELPLQNLCVGRGRRSLERGEALVQLHQRGDRAGVPTVVGLPPVSGLRLRPQPRDLLQGLRPERVHQALALLLRAAPRRAAP
mmetsp:Transcript_11611/g.35324  ORF Transcript_11611/g.35324 Transcript_11611/m.35324 type:complete len:484 (-) Transcript_11611:842-2293(-)